MNVDPPPPEGLAHLAEMVRSADAAVISFTNERRISSWNAGAERLFGFPAGEAVGSDLLMIAPEDRRAELLDCEARARAGESYTMETVCRRKSGQTVEVSISFSPVFNARREVYASMAIFADLTERKFLERALLEAGERESRRIGQELHDHLCQHLLGAAFSAKALAMGLPRDSSGSTELHDLARLINSAVQQTRDIARELNPVGLDAAGLMNALQELASRARTGIVCRLECVGEVLLADREAALHAFRVAQEAVANAVRHSGGTEIVIRFTEDSENIILQIEDNGRGFDPEAKSRGGLGLEVMKYRARAIAGKVSIHTSLERGTRVMLLLPKRER